jgi:7-carboxy-7-deazaguanine synthase (Cx14CxxC type)
VGVGPDGGRFTTPESLAAAVARAWRGDDAESRFVVCTGGEPLLQVDDHLVEAFHAEGFTVAVETNGTREAPSVIDWVCVSPKAGAPLVQKSGSELKLVFPQSAAMPPLFESLDFDHFFLQPMDGPSVEENTRLAVEYCMAHPKWRLSLQTHKALGIR